MSGIRCVAVDFDNTLAYFKNPTEKGLFDVFRRRGVREEHIRKAYEESSVNGFSIANFMDCIAKIHGSISDEESISQDFENWLQSSLALYSDSLSAIQNWQAAGIPVVIVTFGNPEYQRQKIKMVNISCDGVEVVSPPRRKFEVIGELLGKYGAPIVFIDDKQTELDEVRARFPESQVTTLLAARPDSPYRNKSAKYFHFVIGSLEKASLLLRLIYGHPTAPKDSNGVTIRRAETSDVLRIGEINAKVFLGHRDNPQAGATWTMCLLNAFPVYQFFVAEVDGKVAGYIGWQIHGGFMRPEPVVELEQLGVDPEFQGRGMGPMLEETIFTVIELIKQINTRIESYIYVSVWSYALNLNAMKIYAEKFNEGVQGFRRMYGDRAENMLRWRIPLIRPARKDD